MKKASIRGSGGNLTQHFICFIMFLILYFEAVDVHYTSQADSSLCRPFCSAVCQFVDCWLTEQCRSCL
eukprot:scaffold102436_cov21-Prasinocladus_malaysianus.AAC.1